MTIENTTKHISKEAITKIKQELLDREQEILKELDNMSKADNHEQDNRTAKFPEYGDKADENAQEISEYSTTVVAEGMLEKTLRDVKSTLKRIEDNTYGICKYCQNPINEKRLIARPIASTCVECKTKIQNS